MGPRTRSRNLAAEAAACIAKKRQLVSQGRCSMCGASKAEGDPQWMCRACSDRYNLWRQQHRAKHGRVTPGHCLNCNQPLADGSQSKRCPKCRAAHNEDSRLRYKNLLEGSQCTKCARQPRLSDHTLCADCLFKASALQNMGTAEHWDTIKRLWQEQHGLCAYTTVPLTLGVDAQLDHKYPTSRFPELRNQPSNVHWVHGSVNGMKQDLTHDEFMAVVGHIVNKTASATDILVSLRAFKARETKERKARADRLRRTSTPAH